MSSSTGDNGARRVSSLDGFTATPEQPVVTRETVTHQPVTRRGKRAAKRRARIENKPRLSNISAETARDFNTREDRGPSRARKALLFFGGGMLAAAMLALVLGRSLSDALRSGVAFGGLHISSTQLLAIAAIITIFIAVASIATKPRGDTDVSPLVQKSATTVIAVGYIGYAALVALLLWSAAF